MSGSRAAIRYAKAILQRADEANLVDAIFADMQKVKATLADHKELRVVLKSPVVKAEDKKAVLLQIFDAQSYQTKELIEVLVKNHRTDILGDVAESFMKLYNEAKGVKVAQVTTAVPLSSELEAQVLSKVKQITGSDHVSLESTIDPSIIGGFILRVDDLQYNASIANKLGNIKREFSKSV